MSIQVSLCHGTRQKIDKKICREFNNDHEKSEQQSAALRVHEELQMMMSCYFSFKFNYYIDNFEYKC